MCSSPIRLQDSLNINISERKQSLSSKIFSLRDSYQRKITCETAAVNWVSPGVPGHPQTCLNLSWGDFGWFGDGMALLKIVQNERLIKF